MHPQAAVAEVDTSCIKLLAFQIFNYQKIGSFFIPKRNYSHCIHVLYELQITCKI